MTMKRTASLLFSLGAAFAGPAQAKTLTIGLDVSASNPVVGSPSFAKAAGAHAGKAVAALAPGDTVVLRVIGDRRVENARSETITITRRMPAAMAGRKIGAYIAALPARLQGDGQGETSIIAWFTLNDFKCAEDGAVIVYTDGVENSEVISGDRFLAGRPLPKPEARNLNGCAVSMIGVGQSAQGEIPLKTITRMTSAWAAWLKAAGAKAAVITSNP